MALAIRRVQSYCTMKTFKTVITALLIACSFSLGFAGSNNDGGFFIENPTMLKERVVSVIHVPAPTGMHLEGTVQITFRVQETGQVQLMDLDGDNEYLNDQVRKDVKGLHLIAAPEMHNNVYKMKLVYGDGVL